MIRVQQERFDAGSEINKFLLMNDNSGAVSSFIGQARDFMYNEKKEKSEVNYLEIEHYPGMVDKEINRIVMQAKSRWKINKVLVIHRYGLITPGEEIVLICTSSDHRDEAFKSCNFIIDFIKTQAPFWKYEYSENVKIQVVNNESDKKKTDAWIEK